mmetsp:Transcript_14619/g.47618  ORF Transcript_14619/g.47618 Transcript_14619/m.47618 type:complete len:278 (+) Transcript_14619:1036-1869(+)
MSSVVVGSSAGIFFQSVCLFATKAVSERPASRNTRVQASPRAHGAVVVRPRRPARRCRRPRRPPPRRRQGYAGEDGEAPPLRHLLPHGLHRQGHRRPLRCSRPRPVQYVQLRLRRLLDADAGPPDERLLLPPPERPLEAPGLGRAAPIRRSLEEAHDASLRPPPPRRQEVPQIHRGLRQGPRHLLQGLRRRLPEARGTRLHRPHPRRMGLTNATSSVEGERPSEPLEPKPKPKAQRQRHATTRKKKTPFTAGGPYGEEKNTVGGKKTMIPLSTYLPA